MSIYPGQVSNQNTTVIKVLLLGQSNVGKTSLITQYADHTFDNNNMMTLGMDVKKINKKINQQNIKLQLWDTAGQQKYQNIPKSYYKNVHGIILVYDITVGETYLRIQDWMERIEQNRKLEQLILMLVGNKKDLEDRRQINEIQAREFASTKTMKFRQTSAMKLEQIEAMVDQIIRCIINKQKASNKNLIVLEKKKNNYNKNKNNQCC